MVPGGEDLKIEALSVNQLHHGWNHSSDSRQKRPAEHRSITDHLKPASALNVFDLPRFIHLFVITVNFLRRLLSGDTKQYWQLRGWFEVEVVTSAFVSRASLGSKCVYVGEKQAGHMNSSQLNLIKARCACLSLHLSPPEGSLICATNLPHAISAGRVSPPCR